MTIITLGLICVFWIIFLTRKTEGEKVADELKTTNKMLVAAMRQKETARYTAHGTRIH